MKHIVIFVFLFTIQTPTPASIRAQLDLRDWLRQETELAPRELYRQAREQAWRDGLERFIGNMNVFIGDLNAGRYNHAAWVRAQKNFHKISDPAFCKCKARKTARETEKKK